MVVSSLVVGLTACGDESEETASEPPTVDYSKAKADFIEALDTDHAVALAQKIIEGEATNSSEFGDRMAGSDAEHAIADLLVKEMEDIGLVDIEKIATPVDKWQFNGASILLEGESEAIPLHSYATAATPAGGIDAEIIYVGTGTTEEYEGLDVKDKIVLFDVNMRDYWWLTYPMLEAELHGAAAALSCANEGFSEISPDAYNCNDICGPTAIPTVSITVNQAQIIKDKLKEGKLTGHLEVDNIVEPGGETYNVLGKIPGKDSSEVIAFGGHYDAYFEGFQDDTIAATGALAIAKAFKDSGYVPERDLWFIMHGAEEWGASGTQFDWCIGAYELIHNARPEWQGKIMTFFNFELPGYEFADYTYATTATELFSFAKDFAEAEDTPKPAGVFKDGVQTDGYQTYTYSDDFSYLIAGVPTVINGFLFTADYEDVFPFYYETYHTNFDTKKDTYNEDVYRFNLEYYGTMGIEVDKNPALQLDYNNQVERLKEAMDTELADGVGVKYDEYLAAIDDYEAAVAGLNDKIKDINDRYDEALKADSADLDELSSIRDEGRALNKENLKIFRATQDGLLGLQYEEPMVPHESPQYNIELIDGAVGAMQDGDVESALDDYAIAINGWNAAYNVYFSKEVTDQFYDMFYSKENADNLYWGTDREFPWANVDDAVRSMAKIAAEGKKSPDLSNEIKEFNNAKDELIPIYQKRVDDETACIVDLTGMIGSI